MARDGNCRGEMLGGTWVTENPKHTLAVRNAHILFQNERIINSLLLQCCSDVVSPLIDLLPVPHTSIFCDLAIVLVFLCFCVFLFAYY